MNYNSQNTRFKREKTEDYSSLLYSKIPPSAIELERCVIGAILIDSSSIVSVSNLLKPEIFYKDSNATIYRTIQSLYLKSEPIDLLTVTERLRKDGKLEEVGGVYELSLLTNEVASSANIEHHSHILIQKHIQRELIRISNDVIKDSYEDTSDVFDILNDTEVRLNEIKSTINSSNINTALYIVNKIKADIINPPEIPLFVPTTLGIKYNYGTVNAIGAKPACGKTALMIQSAIASALQDINVGILSLELKNRLLVPKMIHHYKGTFASKIIENNLTEQETDYLLSEKFDVFNKIFIDDKRTTNLNIRSKIITLVLKYKVKIVWLDYIQLVGMVKDKNTTDVKAMEDLMNTLQDTAKELDIAIVILSQMKRGWEKPTVEELRGGGIEAACSKVYLMYDENSKDNDGKKFLDIDELIRGKLTLIDGKSRFDDTDNQNLYYDKIKQVMKDWNDRDVVNSDYKSFNTAPPKEKEFDIF